MSRAPRLPAEWEPQAAVLIAWPHADTDWGPRLPVIERSYLQLAAGIARFQPLVVVVADAALEQRVLGLAATAGIERRRLHLVQAAYDDTWLRDTGPITLATNGGFALLDFQFTGWGGKFGASRDDRLVHALVAHGLFAHASHQRIDFALEGGAIESDGAGTILTTWRCLSQRHPHTSQAELETALKTHLAAEHVLWLHHGQIEGDDTDAHIDTLARFAPDGAIVFQACDDPDDPHFDELGRMQAELQALRTADGEPWRLHALPWPQPVIDAGRRLAASYANYLVINGAVLVPAYGDAADAVAQQVIAAAHPGRQIVPVDARPLIWQNGSIHCLTMQLPAGALA